MKFPKRFKTFLKRRRKAGNAWGFHAIGKKLFGEIPKGAPRSFWRRQLWYLHPERFHEFWLSKAGAKKILRVGTTCATALIVAVVGLFIFYAKDLPSPGQINTRVLAQTTKFYDRTGEHLLYEVFGDQNREVVELDEISANLHHATIAVEDKNFYDQGAFSAFAIVRAAANNAWNKLFGSDDAIQGGSTITQQYVKNALLSPERTFSRKIKELILAIQIEGLYNKDDILELYLNEIPYGALAYGAEAAAETFFSKSASNLTIEEAAMLAALPRAPTFYSPYGQHTDALVARQQTIIDLMHEQGYVSAEEAEQAKAVDILKKVNDTPDYFSNIDAPHFVLMVQEELEEKYGARTVAEGGLTVTTTLDWEKQQLAEKAVQNGIKQVEQLGGNNAALVSMDTDTAETLAMVGSRKFSYPKYGSFNAALSGRQPGSSFKPYAYATLFDTGKWGPGSVMYDVQTDFGGGYQPDNFDFNFKGAMPIRKALGESRNIPAVKSLYIAGVENVIDQAHKMGITTLNEPERYGLSLVLGAGEVKLYDHVNGYTTFGSGGIQRDPVNILQVTDADGNVLEEHQPTDGERVLDREVAYSITDILSDDAARAGTFGFNNPNINVPGTTMAVKTGTTDESRDGWMMGYSKHMTTGVWVGNHDNKPMHSITSQQTGPIFTEFMEQAHQGLPDKKFEQPPGMKQVTLDSFTGRLPTDDTEQQHTDIFPSFYTPPEAQDTETAVIDKVSGRLATKCTPELAKKEITGGGIEPEIPPEDPAYPRWNPPVQALADRLDISGSIPTKEDNVHTCKEKDQPKVELEEAEETEIQGVIDLSATVKSGKFKVDEVNFKRNGQIVSAQTQTCSKRSTCQYQATFHAPSAGNYTFTVEVIDAGYYQASDTESGSASGAYLGESSFQPLSPSSGENVDGNGLPTSQEITFKWGDNSSAGKYIVYVDGSEEYSGGDKSQDIEVSDGSHTWYIEAYRDGDLIQRTKKVSFTVDE